MTLFCYKVKNHNQKDVNNSKEDDNYVFVLQHGVHSKAMWKWIMNFKTTNNMIFW